MPAAPCSLIESFQVNIDTTDAGLKIEFHLSGQMDAILWPEAKGTGLRQMDLWKHTCFECFVGPARSPDYLEINISPAGSWNVFTFDDVREGMRESGESNVRSTLTRTDRSAQLVAELSLPLSGNMRLGVSAVIEACDNSLHYFALAHQGGRPDFHRRDNHNLELELK